MSSLHYKDLSVNYNSYYNSYTKQIEGPLARDALSFISREDLANKDMVLADIGAGTGRLFSLLTEKETFRKFLAVEPCRDLLDQVKVDTIPVESFCMSGQAFSKLENVKYDTAVVYGAIHHFPVEDLAGFFSGVINQINPGGTVLISTYSDILPFPLWPQVMEFVKKSTPHMDDNTNMSHLQDVLREAGFVDVTCVKKIYEGVTVPRGTFVKMTRGRFISPLSKFNDDEIEEGIRSMNYSDPVIFDEYQYYVKGRKPAAH